MPRRKLELDDEQYEELEDMYHTLDAALLDYADFEYLSPDDYVDMLANARDFLQGLIDEAEYVNDDTRAS